MVTDYGEGDNTDFILSPRAYGRMAVPDKSAQLYSYGVVDVEYRRVPCRYSNYNLMFKVHEHSRNPHYIAIVILYAAGQNEILSVEVWRVRIQKTLLSIKINRSSIVDFKLLTSYWCMYAAGLQGMEADEKGVWSSFRHG